MDIQDYLVTLCVRPAELSGVKELPGATKDRITPILLLAPWLSTTPLSRAIEKFEKSFSARPYFIDVDPYYQVNDKPNEAKALWESLSAEPANLEAWWTLLADHPNANPCLLLAGQGIEAARAQIDWARENNRTFCVRMNFETSIGNSIPDWLPDLITELGEEGANDYAIVLEFGWVSDALQVAASAVGYVTNILSSTPPEVPVAISCTSFPKDFTPFDGVNEVMFTNRDLLSQIQRSTNHPRIVYGDWATTRPRSYGRASQPKNRIDYPGDNSWIFARDQAESVDFQTAARRVTANSAWTGDLGIWGEQLIDGTAAGQAFAIDTMPKMYAARINIHLHRQAYYGALPPPRALDEEWSDDDL